VFIREERRGEVLPRPPDCRCLSERRGENRCCRKDLIAGVYPRVEERRGIDERTRSQLDVRKERSEEVLPKEPD